MAKKNSGDEIKKTFQEMKQDQREINAGAKQLEESMAKQLEMQRDILKMKKNIAHLDNEKVKIENQVSNDLKGRRKWQKKYQEARQKGDKVAAKAAAKELESLRKKIKLQRISLEQADAEIKIAEDGLETMQKMVKESNKLKSAFKSMKGAVKTWGWDKLKSWGVFEMDKAIRDSARSMGVGAKNFDSFSNSISSASESTIMMGSGIKNLAKMQAGYSKEIGRSVQLTEEGHIAMAGLAEGTGLGEEFAIGMASSMDNFGAGVEASADLVEETMNIAGEMGVNGAKAAETLRKSLKFAQKFHFKGGVKGLARMAAEAERLKLDMDGIAGLAEKVFRPEGAVEMAAKLQTMGGEFAKLGDPMQLMFKARNDFEGFAKDIGKATSEFVEFNKENGTFDVKGGLAADRMREIAKMTGIAEERLSEMAVQQKKIEAIGSISPINFSKEDKELVAGMSEFNEDNNSWEVNINGRKELVKDLSTLDLEKLKKEKESLETRAKQARSFQDVIMDVWEQVQSILLPVAQELKEQLGGPIQGLVKQLKEGGFMESIKGFVKGIASFVGGVGKWVIENPLKSLAAIGLFKAAQWITNGAMLAMGFNMTARVGGGGGSFMSGSRNAMSNWGGGKGVKGAIGRSMGGKYGMGTAKGMGMGMGLGLGGMALNYGRNQMDDPDSNMGKAMGVGSSALSGAGMGMMFGPLGGIIGGIGGAAYGAYNEYSDSGHSSSGNMGYGDTPNQINDGIIQFNPRDKFTTVDDAILASTSENQLNSAAKTLTNDSVSKVEHKFEDININIKLKVKGLDTEIGKQMINTTQFKHDITTMVHEESRKALSHKASPNLI